MKRYLILEDGSVYQGKQFGGRCHGRVGELVFTTAMTGYQEAISDPSYRGQTVVFTNPTIGNTGINRDDLGSLDLHLDGLVVKECCRHPSNWRMAEGLDSYLERRNVPGIEGVDTRSLALKIRDRGTMKCLISDSISHLEDVVKKIRKTPCRKDQAKEVMTKKIYDIPTGGKRIALMDFGVTLDVIHDLVKRGCSLTVVPGDTSFEKILAFQPDGILVSNGPGDPRSDRKAVSNIQKLIESGLPLLGLCLGHQLVCLACGGETYQLKFGHRGANHPVVDLTTGRTEITFQNHGYAVSEESLGRTPLAITHRNLNDGSVEGVRHRKRPVFGVQFHPTSLEGSADSNPVLDRFVALMDQRGGRRDA